MLFCSFAFTSVEEVGNKTCFLFIYQISIVMVPPPPPSSGDSTVSVGEGVPGACLLPPPNGPGGAFPVAGPDDALSLGQHDRPREADPVSPSVRHWPQVGIGTRSSANALLQESYADIYQRVNGCWVNETECLCLSFNLPLWCFIVILSVRHYFCTTAPQMHQSPSWFCIIASFWLLIAGSEYGQNNANG